MNAMTTTTGGLRCHAASGHRGFTLIETALATMIVGTGVLAIVLAQQTFHKHNQWALQAATGMRLGGEIRELMMNLPRHDPVTGTETWGPEGNESGVPDFDDVDDFDDAVFSSDLGNGPLSAMRNPINNLPGWSQRIVVRSVDPFDIRDTVLNGSSIMLRVDTIVEYRGDGDLEAREVTRVTWIQPR
ncbi:MAG: hypothetical protein MK085_06190 [Phycisphaerales bacterium]|nr:hypothetical protein [Phycisphaerales bacterium]